MSIVNSIRNLSAKRLRPLRAFLRKSNPATACPATACYGNNANPRTLLKDCVVSLYRSPPKAAVLICALALTLPACFAIFSASFKAAADNLLENRHITVFLNARVNEATATQLASTLATNQHIRTAEFSPVSIPAGQVLTIDIQPSTSLDQTQLDSIVAELNSHSSVDFVAADSAWLQRNGNAIEATKQFGWLSVGVTVLITMILAFALTRIDLLWQKPELAVLQQMGASKRTALRPLILRSLLLTTVAIVVGTMLAWTLIAALPHIGDMSSYRRILPDYLPIKNVTLLILIALASSFLTIKLQERSL